MSIPLTVAYYVGIAGIISYIVASIVDYDSCLTNYGIIARLFFIFGYHNIITIWAIKRIAKIILKHYGVRIKSDDIVYIEGRKNVAEGGCPLKGGNYTVLIETKEKIQIWVWIGLLPNYNLSWKWSKICPECGNFINDEILVCPTCGRQNSNSDAKKNGKGGHSCLITTIIILVVTVLGFLYFKGEFRIGGTMYEIENVPADTAALEENNINTLSENIKKNQKKRSKKHKSKGKNRHRRRNRH